MTEDKAVECTEHGTRDTTYVCRHLPQGQGVGFHQSLEPDQPDTLFPDAWCDACEAVRVAEGEWNERSEAVAGISLLCSGCYLRARLLNWPRDTHTETARLIERSVPYLEEQQDRLRVHYRLNEHERYDWDQDSGRLVFSNAGVPSVVASIQFVGSVSTRSQTWMWSWANQSYLESVRSQVRSVRAYGDEHHLLKLACAYWGAEEADGWEMAAVTAFLLQAKGAYRSPGDSGFTFMVMTDVRWAQ
jgi:hypothetical protein